MYNFLVFTGGQLTLFMRTQFWKRTLVPFWRTETYIWGQNPVVLVKHHSPQEAQLQFLAIVLFTVWHMIAFGLIPILKALCDGKYIATPRYTNDTQLKTIVIWQMHMVPHIFLSCSGMTRPFDLSRRRPIFLPISYSSLPAGSKMAAVKDWLVHRCMFCSPWMLSKMEMTRSWSVYWRLPGLLWALCQGFVCSLAIVGCWEVSKLGMTPSWSVYWRLTGVLRALSQGLVCSLTPVDCWKVSKMAGVTDYWIHWGLFCLLFKCSQRRRLPTTG